LYGDIALAKKTIELLERYAINPLRVGVEPSENREGFYLRIEAYPGIPSEQLEGLHRLYTDLGIEDTHSLAVNEGYAEMYDLLNEAVEKAPKSFTRYR